MNRLIASGVNVNAKDNKGRTPLHRAIDYGYHSIVEALLAAGASVSVKDDIGQTPLHMASGDITANVLLEAGAEVNAKSNSGWTPLHLAVQYIRGSVDVFLEAGADVNAKAKGGWTPLHMAVRSPRWERDFEIINALLAAGANVNAKSNTGWTPLHMAVSDKDYPSRKSIDALIAAGADVNTVNNNGEKPLDVGLQYGSGDASLLNSLIGPSKVDLTVMPGSPAPVSASALTIERVEEERTEVRWEGGVLQFSPNANGQWRDVILDQGFFRLRPQD